MTFENCGVQSTQQFSIGRINLLDDAVLVEVLCGQLHDLAGFAAAGCKCSSFIAKCKEQKFVIIFFCPFNSSSSFFDNADLITLKLSL